MKVDVNARICINVNVNVKVYANADVTPRIHLTGFLQLFPGHYQRASLRTFYISHIVLIAS